MFGWRIFRETEFEMIMRLADTKLSHSEQDNRKLERLVEYWQEREEAQRVRADRQLDVLLQQNGLPPVTETVTNEIAERYTATQKERDEQDRMMKQMFTETIEDLSPPEEIINE